MNVKIKAIAIMLIYGLAGLAMWYVMYQNGDTCLSILGFPIGLGLLWCIIDTFNEIVKELNKKN